MSHGSVSACAAGSVFAQVQITETVYLGTVANKASDIEPETETLILSVKKVAMTSLDEVILLTPSLG